jgi:signal transduction histidine kinase
MLDQIQALLKSMKNINDNIAHDLRSPLARIRGAAEMALMGKRSEQDYREMAVNTMEECDSLIDMVNTMLDITESEAGVQEVRWEPVDLSFLISEAIELFRPIADERLISLRAELPAGLAIRGDRKKMQRVVTNLLENAIKFTPEHGEVAVSGSRLDGGIELAFQDTGVGISESDLPRIFERFYRCDRSRSEGGVGLGLCLVKAYTEAMGGRITVASTLGKGSVFRLAFSHPPSLRIA